jgi:hypothetical protein
MSNWDLLNKQRVTVWTPRVPARYLTTAADGFMGLFRITIGGKCVRCIASDGEGWQHVSVSIEYETKPPSWEIMCVVKELFWEDEDWVVQFHPAKSEYVNYHPGCLHLWRYTGDGPKMPTPPSIFVGPK